MITTIAASQARTIRAAAAVGEVGEAGEEAGHVLEVPFVSRRSTVRTTPL